MIGLIAPIIGGLLGGAASGAFGMASAKQQQSATTQQYKHRYQWTMDDLKAAGLNPMLAMNQGAVSGGGAMAMAPTPDIGSSVSQGVARGTEALLARSSAKQLESQAQLNEATAQRQRAETAKATWEAGTAFQQSQMAAMEKRAMERDPDALWRTRYQGPMMRKIDDIASSAKQLYQRHTRADTPENRERERRMKDAPPPW